METHSDRWIRKAIDGGWGIDDCAAALWLKAPDDLGECVQMVSPLPPDDVEAVTMAVNQFIDVQFEARLMYAFLSALTPEHMLDNLRYLRDARMRVELWEEALEDELIDALEHEPVPPEIADQIMRSPHDGKATVTRALTKKLVPMDRETQLGLTLRQGLRLEVAEARRTRRAEAAHALASAADGEQPTA